MNTLTLGQKVKIKTKDGDFIATYIELMNGSSFGFHVEEFNKIIFDIYSFEVI